VSSQTQLRASWGRFFQAQGINELQVEDGIDTFFPAQRADHFILSVEHTFTDSLSARVEAYYKDYDQLRPRFENLFDPLVLLPELETDRVKVAASTGNIQGLEFLVHDRSALPWGWWLSYAFSRAEETVGSEEIPRSWDQRHTFNGGVSWTQGPWEIALAGTWHTGWPTTPVSLAPDSNTDVLIGTQNSARFDTFRSLDLRAGYTFELGDTKLLTFVELINMLALKNPCCVDYTVPDTGTSPAEIQQSFDYWPRFVPNIGILWTF
jgi:outer membrane receptor protein involved in Fe transport